MKTIDGRQFAVMAAVILFSFLLLGSSFAALSYQYIIQERQTALERTADNVVDLTATALTQYNDRSLNSSFIQGNLMYLARIADSGITLTTPEGQIVLALGNDGVIQTGMSGKLSLGVSLENMGEVAVSIIALS